MNEYPLYDLTMPMSGAVQIRNYRPTVVLRSLTTLDGLQRISGLQLFPHSLTHLDLPSRIDWSGYKGEPAMLPPHLTVDSAISEVSTPPTFQMPFSEKFTKYLRNQMFPCTIISLEPLAERMLAKCMKYQSEKRWEGLLPRNPSQLFKDEDFGELLKSLRVTETMLRRIPIPKGDFVVFCTGWRRFAPSDGDLSHRKWYPWHPYLMNPYLDQAAVNYLLDSEKGLNCPGIGCDIGTLDSPLRYVVLNIQEDREEQEPQIPSILQKYLLDENYIPSFGLPKDLRFFPVHVRTFQQGRLLLEQLEIPAELIGPSYQSRENEFSTTQGVLTVLPYQCTGYVDAVLASVLFTPLMGPPPTFHTSLSASATQSPHREERSAPAISGNNSAPRTQAESVFRDCLGILSILASADSHRMAFDALLKRMNEKRLAGQPEIGKERLQSLRTRMESHNLLEGAGNREDVQLKSAGRDKRYQSACEKYLREHFSGYFKDAPPDKISQMSNQIDEWIKGLDVSGIKDYFSDREFDCPRGLRDILENIRHVKVKAGDDVPTRPSPYYQKLRDRFQTLCLESARGKSSVDSSNARKQCVILDTNAIYKLLLRTGDEDTNVAMSLLSARLCDSQHASIITIEETIKELVFTFQDAEYRCNAWEIHGITRPEKHIGSLLRKWEKADPEETITKRNAVDQIRKAFRKTDEDNKKLAQSAVPELTEIGVEYYTSRSSSPTFKTFQNNKIRVLYSSDPLPGLPFPQCCHIKNIAKTLGSGYRAFQKQVERKLLDLLTRQTWAYRKQVIEYHDVSLLLFTNEMRERDPETEYIVWTFHQDLPILALQIDVDPTIVCVGAGLYPMTEQDPESMRAYLNRLFSFIITEEESEEIVRVLQNIGGTIEPHTLAATLLEVVAHENRGSSKEEEEEEKEKEEEETLETGKQSTIEGSLAERLRILRDKGGSIFLDNLDNCEEWIDLTADWGLSPGGHGTRPLEVYWSGQAAIKNPRAMQWYFCPHTGTHIDLPWALDELPLFVENLLKRNKRRYRWVERDTREAQRRLVQEALPAMRKAIFVNLTEYSAHMVKWTRDAEEPSSLPLKETLEKRQSLRAETAGFSNEDVRKNVLRICDDLAKTTPDRLACLVKSLRISREMLEEKLDLSSPRGEILKGAIVILHTGWNYLFSLERDDLSSSVWEGLHPMLLHPWLDKKAVEELVHWGVRGVFIDTLMPDCPLYVASHAAPSKTRVSQASKCLFADRDIFPDRESRIYQPAHVEFLRRFILLGESLHIPTSLNKWYGQSFEDEDRITGKDVEGAFVTDILVTSLYFHLLPDALPIKILARNPLVCAAGDRTHANR